MNSNDIPARSGQDTKLKETQAMLEYDRTKVAECITRIKKTLDGYDWLITGRGSYSWNDDRWHEEFRRASESIREDLEPMEKIAADWRNCPTKAEDIRAARSATPGPHTENQPPAWAIELKNWFVNFMRPGTKVTNPARFADFLIDVAHRSNEELSLVRNDFLAAPEPLSSAAPEEQGARESAEEFLQRKIREGHKGGWTLTEFAEAYAADHAAHPPAVPRCPTDKEILFKAFGNERISGTRKEAVALRVIGVMREMTRQDSPQASATAQEEK